MSYNSHRTGPNRVFDHLYDPLYTTSGEKDIWKENHNALYRSAPVRIYPQYTTMFTDLARRPRNYYIHQRNPLPHFPFLNENRCQNGQTERKCRTAIIGGRDRAKFFNIPLNNEMNMNLQLDIKKDHVCCGQKSLTPTQAHPFRTVACETMYREQSAQTKPWMPDVIVSDLNDECSNLPELLFAAKVITSNGAPGILEVKQLQRARRRRQLENAFAQCKYANDSTMRQEFWGAMEWEDRVGREEELEYCQQLRLGMVKEMMNSRERKMRQNFTYQIKSTANRLEAAKEKKLSNLRINHQRTLRRLDKQYGEKCRRSKVLTQEHQQTSYVSYTTDFEARLEDLHKMLTMPTNLERFTQPKVDITKPKQPIKEVKRGLWTEKFLVNLYDSLKVIQKKIIHQRTAKCLIDIREEVERYVSTIEPSVESFGNELDYQHAVFLQKIIKGRAIQSILHDGKDSNQELIDQLKEKFKLASVWEAECADDWNEDMLMDYLGQYLDQEFVRYAEHKEVHDLRISSELKERLQTIEKENEIRLEQNEVASDCLEKVFKDLRLLNIDATEPIPDSPLNNPPSEMIVQDVLSNLVLPEIYETLTNENLLKIYFDRQNEQAASTTRASEKEKIVADIIEHILQTVIPHTAENITNDIIDDIVKRTVELASTFKNLNADGLDREIGGMLDDLCHQILIKVEADDEADGNESGNDSPDE